METPSSEQFKPTPHQKLTATELIRRVTSLEPMRQDHIDPVPEFWVASKFGNDYDYDGKFELDKENRHVLNYRYEINKSKHDVKVVEIMKFSCGDKIFGAYWERSTFQWILIDPPKRSYLNSVYFL